MFRLKIALIECFVTQKRTLVCAYCYNKHSNFNFPSFSAHGAWSDWSSWSSCKLGQNQECGIGLRERHRTCSNPKPLDGKPCRGAATKKEECARACESTPSLWKVNTFSAESEHTHQQTSDQGKLNVTLNSVHKKQNGHLPNKNKRLVFSLRFGVAQYGSSSIFEFRSLTITRVKVNTLYSLQTQT